MIVRQATAEIHSPYGAEADINCFPTRINKFKFRHIRRKLRTNLSSTKKETSLQSQRERETKRVQEKEGRRNKSSYTEKKYSPPCSPLPTPSSISLRTIRAREGKDESPKVGYKRKGKRVLLCWSNCFLPFPIPKVGQTVEHVTQQSVPLPPLSLPVLLSNSERS